MGFLARILGTTGTGGWILYLVIGAAIYGAGAVSGNWVRTKLDAPTIAQLHADVAAEQGRTQASVNKLLEQQKQTALDLAAANAAALAQNQALAAKAASLGAALATAERARQTASTKLLDTLKAIPHDQQTALPISIKSYLLGVRQQQAPTSGTAAPSDNH